MRKRSRVARKTRWDVFTPYNFEEIQLVNSQDERPPLVESLHSHQAPLLLEKREVQRTNSAWLISPRGLVLRPSQISYSPGAMFFPQRSSTAARQSGCPSCAGWPRRTEPAHNSLEIFLCGKESSVELMLLVSGCLTIFLSDTPTILYYPLPLLFDISI